MNITLQLEFIEQDSCKILIFIKKSEEMKEQRKS